MSLFNVSRLHDKTVLVTGASDGIGKATAVLFARAGANVVLVARRQQALDAAVEECKAANQESKEGKGGQYASLVVDMRKREDLDALLGKLPDWAKKVDVLVNNAGLVLGTDKGESSTVLRA